jgi:hypothetical protein
MSKKDNLDNVSNYGAIPTTTTGRKTRGLGALVRTMIHFRKPSSLDEDMVHDDDDEFFDVDDNHAGDELYETSKQQQTLLIPISMQSVPLLGEYSNTNRYIRNASTRLQRSHRSEYRISNNFKDSQKQPQEILSTKQKDNSSFRFDESEKLQRRLDEIFVLELMKDG